MERPSRPWLQLAVDVLDLAEAVRMARLAGEYADIIEVGTPLIIEAGVAAVAALKQAQPGRRVLADLKIMDAGKMEATSAFVRGADVVTVLGLASDATVRGAVEAARVHRGLIMADMVNVPDAAARGRELERLGVDILCLHTAYDRQGEGIDPLDELHHVRPHVSGVLALAGGLKLARAAEAVQAGADVLVVGGGILNEPDPAAAARAIRQAMDQAVEQRA